MGSRRSANPTVDFVIEVLKTFNDDDMQRVARFVNERMSVNPIIDIPTHTSKHDSSSLNNLLPLLLNKMQNTNSTPNPNANSNLMSTLQTLLSQKQGQIRKVEKIDDDDDDDDYEEDHDNGHHNPLGKLINLFGKGHKNEEPVQVAAPLTAAGPLNALLPKVLEMGSQFMTASNTREEQLVDALASFLPPNKQDKLRTLSPAFRIVNMLTANGTLPPLGDILKKFKKKK